MTSHPQDVKKLPLICKLLYLIAGISALLYLAFTQSPSFADWFNSRVSFLCRRLLSYLTVWIPFSLAEWLLILIPVFMVTLIVIAKRSYCDSWRSVGVYLGKLSSVLCVIWILFSWNFAPGYYGTTLDQKLSLKREKSSAEDLYRTAEVLRADLEELSKEIVFYLVYLDCKSVKRLLKSLCNTTDVIVCRVSRGYRDGTGRREALFVFIGSFQLVFYGGLHIGDHSHAVLYL